MPENDKIQLFEDQKIRTAWDEENEEWYFSIVDVVGVLSNSKDPATYWRKLKQRLKAEGNDAKQHFQPDPLTAPFVLDAFKKYDEGSTMTEIRDWLNGKGIKNTRGQAMTYNSVQHLLKNRRYMGEFKYRDVVVPDGIPALVPKDLFDRVQEKLAKPKISAEFMTFWLQRFRKLDVT